MCQPLFKKANIEHVVLEKEPELTHAWRRKRWDNFTLVTPNWQCLLPEHPYMGNQPDGFMKKMRLLNIWISLLKSSIHL